MLARIIENRVAEVFAQTPELGAGECALVVEVAPDVQPGWLWTPEGCTAPPAPSAPDPNAAIDAEILSIEATVTQRRLREALLTDEGKTWLADVEARIEMLRALRSPAGEDPA